MAAEEFFSPTGQRSSYRYIYSSGQRCIKGDIVALKESGPDTKKFVLNRGNGSSELNPTVWISDVKDDEQLVRVSDLQFLRRKEDYTDEDKHDFQRETKVEVEHTGTPLMDQLRDLLEQLQITEKGIDKIISIADNEHSRPSPFQ